ncbi:MAG TPA: hypothetical protein VMV79_03895 [Alphaproteobacteria bacterium]|nr:hypothetical protein [Alphaproteobacteria bacterium]
METQAAVRTNPNVAWWISSLAISVVCCAILFVVFASYLVDINKGMAVLTATTDVRLQALEDRQNQLSADLENMRRRSVQQIQIVPANAPQAAPPAAKAPAPAPLPAKKK